MNLTDRATTMCQEFGVSDAEVSNLLKDMLDLTREVAHAVERPAAPITLLVLGLAAQGDPAKLPALLERTRALLPAE